MDVLISGVLTDGEVEDHKYNAIGRKLKIGDRLCLIYYSALGSGNSVQVSFEMNFCFGLNKLKSFFCYMMFVTCYTKWRGI